MTGPAPGLLECVINVSEGRDKQVISALAAAAGPCVLDVHCDPDHHRSVLTLAGPPEAVDQGVRALARTAVASIDVGGHVGAHPRIGALDVVPFVHLDSQPGPISRQPGPIIRQPGPISRQPGPISRQPGPRAHLGDGSLGRAVEARDRFAGWAGRELALPCFLYGPERTLPELRRGAWTTLVPDAGPAAPHPTAGAAAVGARPVLVAYNLWLAGADLALARRVARSIRSPEVRALGLAVGPSVQVSCNLIAPWRVGPGVVFDAVASQAGVARAELVGLVPLSVLEAEPRHRWLELGLSPSATIEARLETAGLNGGRFGGHRA